MYCTGPNYCVDTNTLCYTSGTTGVVCSSTSQPTNCTSGLTTISYTPPVIAYSASPSTVNVGAGWSSYFNVANTTGCPISVCSITGTNV